MALTCPAPTRIRPSQVSPCISLFTAICSLWWNFTTAHRLEVNMFCTYSACSKTFCKIKLTMKFYMLSNCLLSSELATFRQMLFMWPHCTCIHSSCIRVLSFHILTLFSVIIRKYGQNYDSQHGLCLEDKVKHCL